MSKTSDPSIDDMLEFFRENSTKQYQITGINPIHEDYLVRTCSYMEWFIVVGELVKASERERIANPIQLGTLLGEGARIEDEGLSKLSDVILLHQDYFTKKICKAIIDANDVLKVIGKQLYDVELTCESILDLYILLSKNPAGVESKLLNKMIRSGIYTVPTTTDKAEQERVQVFRSLSEAITGDMLKQKLVGINPTSSDGETLLVEIAYWMAGFSATCTFTTARIGTNSELVTPLMETSLNVLMRETISIEHPLHGAIIDTLEDILENKRMLLIQSGMRSWNNPMINQYASSNLGQFDKDTLIESMEWILHFMKANDGFRTEKN